MRISIDVGLLVLLGSAMLAGCGNGKTSIGGGKGGGTTIASTGGTVAISGGGAVPSSTKLAIGGTGGTSPGGTGGTPSGGHGGSAAGGAGGTTVGGTAGTTAGGTGGASVAAAGGTTVGGRGGSSAGGAGGSTLIPIAGGPCSLDGQQSDCATAGANPCLQCRGGWLICQRGTWSVVHCDPIPEPPVEPRPDAASDAMDAADVSSMPDGAGVIDGTGTLRGYLVFANEVMAFEACGTTNLIWANLQGWEAGKELLPALGPVCVPTDGGFAPCPGTIYVELVGSIVSGGSYGHMNKYSQELTVNRYLAASLTGPADCPFLPPAYVN